MRIGVDVGGTNTDAVLMDGATVVASIKAPTTADVGAGVVAAIEGVMAQSAIAPEAITGVMIGTTQFTNAIVERRRLVPVAIVRLALPATESLNPLIDWPRDLVDVIGRHVYMAKGGYEVDGREISPLDEAEIAGIARDIADKGLESIAISSVFAPLNSAQEDRAAEIIRAEHPEAQITLSNEIGRVGLIERENAAVMNAALVSLSAKVVGSFGEALKALSIEAPFFISQNDGTLMSAAYVERYPVLTFASGPTNSMRGAAFLSDQENAVVVDIGGTTTDVGVLARGFPRESAVAVDVGGVRTNFRMPDVLAIGLARNASPTPPRREGPPSPGRSGCRTTARSEHAASPTAGTGADRAPPSHRTARSVAPAAPREPACPSSQGTTHAASAHAASGASSSRAPVPQSLPVPWLDHPIRDSCANYGTRDLIRPSLAGHHRAAQVDRHHPVEARLVEVRERRIPTRIGDALVVLQHVDAPVALDDGLDDRNQRRLLGHVGDQRLGAATVDLDHCGGFVGRRAVAIERDHVCAGAGEEHTRGSAVTDHRPRSLAGAGHDRDPAVEAQRRALPGWRAGGGGVLGHGDVRIRGGKRDPKARQGRASCQGVWLRRRLARESVRRAGHSTIRHPPGADCHENWRHHLRHPIVTAKAVASLDLVSGGRFEFGIGAGWNAEEMEHHGTRFETRFRLMEDRVKAMQAIWAADEASYEGEFTSFEPSWSWPKPMQKPHPPILLGGETVHTMRRVMDFCSGWFPRGAMLPDPAEGMNRLSVAAADAGRDPATVSATVFGAPAEAGYLDACREAGIDRALLLLPSEGRDGVMPLVDRYAALIG